MLLRWKWSTKCRYQVHITKWDFPLKQRVGIDLNCHLQVTLFRSIRLNSIILFTYIWPLVLLKLIYSINNFLKNSHCLMLQKNNYIHTIIFLYTGSLLFAFEFCWQLFLPSCCNILLLLCFSKMVWQKMHDFRNRTNFISGSSATSVELKGSWSRFGFLFMKGWPSTCYNMWWCSCEDKYDNLCECH